MAQVKMTDYAAKQLNLQYLTQAISGIQQLRSTVVNVFSFLCDGAKPDEEDDGKSDEIDNPVSVGKDGKKFLQRFQEYLEAVNKDYNEVEKCCNNMTSISGFQPLGSSGLLSLDSIADKNCSYRDIALTYQWNNRLHEYSQMATSLLLMNHSKRAPLQAANPLAKRRRNMPPKFHSVSLQQVDSSVSNLDHQLQECSLKLIQARGDSKVLQVTVGRVFTVVVVLRSSMIEKFLVKGLDENIMSEDGTVDLFTESRYECMRRITDIAMSAVLQHVCQASVPEFPLRYIMIWLNSYRNLFSDPCTVCGKHLDSEALPPLWRDYRTPAACHDSCRP